MAYEVLALITWLLPASLTSSLSLHFMLLYFCCHSKVSPATLPATALAVPTAWATLVADGPWLSPSLHFEGSSITSPQRFTTHSTAAALHPVFYHSLRSYPTWFFFKVYQSLKLYYFYKLIIILIPLQFRLYRNFLFYQYIPSA